jgi:hypothetical protein
MTDCSKPIRSESAFFRADGSRKGKGVVLLYPDRLVSVKTYVEYVCWFVIVLILDVVAYRIFHVVASWLVPFFGILLGGVIGRAVDRWLAPGMVAPGAGNTTIIPLDGISSLRTDRSGGLAGLFPTETVVVTTADGTEYEFRGTMEKWQDHLSDALTARGCGVYPAIDGIMVTPPSTWAEG